MLMLLVGAQVGCGDDPETTQSIKVETLAACDESDFASFAFVGPGIDSNGALVDTGQKSYVVGATAAYIQPDNESKFFELTGAVFQSLSSSDGFIGFSAGTSDQCGLARTLTVWKDDASLMQFVVSDAHAAAMAAGTDVISQGATTSYVLPADQIPPSWDDAVARVAIVPVLY